MTDVSAKYQFTISRLTAVTAVLAIAFVGFTIDNLASSAMRLVFGLLLSVFIFKVGIRCLLGAVVGAVVLAGMLYVLTQALNEPESAPSLWQVFLHSGLVGAAIGGGIHGARLEHRSKVDQPANDNPVETFSVERVAILPIGFVALWPVWQLANVIGFQFGLPPQAYFWVTLVTTVVIAITLARLIDVLFKKLTVSRTSKHSGGQRL